jgi:hypothetical protein
MWANRSKGSARSDCLNPLRALRSDRSVVLASLALQARSRSVECIERSISELDLAFSRLESDSLKCVIYAEHAVLRAINPHLPARKGNCSA